MATRARALVLLVASALFLFASCAANPRSVPETNANHNVVSSTPPFETKEPERYSATRVIMTVVAGEQPVVAKSLIARNGELRRDESETLGQRVVLLVLAEEKFLLLPDEKLFASVPDADVNSEEGESDVSPDRLLHEDLLTTSYENVGTETLGGRSVQKYRVVVNSSRGDNVSNGETFLWFDEGLHMPVKTETKSPDGKRVTTELTDVVLTVDKRLFEIPGDYQKTEFKNLRSRLKQNQP